MNNKPWWKVLWSYISDLVVEQSTSEHNTELIVIMSKGRYQLCTPNAIYSYEDKYDNFGGAFLQLGYERLSTYDNVLILGLGLGSIPIILERSMGLRLSYTVVEIDEEVVRLATTYGLSELNSQIEYIVADAATFVQLDARTYDMVCMDIFLDDEIPFQFETVDFLEKLKGRIAPNGILLFNRLASTEQDRTASLQYYKKVFSKVFKNKRLINLRTNYMLVGET